MNPAVLPTRTDHLTFTTKKMTLPVAAGDLILRHCKIEKSGLVLV